MTHSKSKWCIKKTTTDRKLRIFLDPELKNTRIVKNCMFFISDVNLRIINKANRETIRLVL